MVARASDLPVTIFAISRTLGAAGGSCGSRLAVVPQRGGLWRRPHTIVMIGHRAHHDCAHRITDGITGKGSRRQLGLSCLEAAPRGVDRGCCRQEVGNLAWPDICGAAVAATSGEMMPHLHQKGLLGAVSPPLYTLMLNSPS